MACMVNCESNVCDKLSSYRRWGFASFILYIKCINHLNIKSHDLDAGAQETT